MTTFNKALGIGMLATLVFMSPLGNTFGQKNGAGPGAFGGELRGMTRLRGKVLCINCTLEDARKAQPNQLDLYLIKNQSQQAVMYISAIDNSASGRESLLGRWAAITGMTRELAIRGDAQVWRKLTTEENLRKEVEIIGLLQSTGTFDVANVNIMG